MYGAQWLALLRSPENIRRKSFQGGRGGIETLGLWSFSFLQCRRDGKHPLGVNYYLLFLHPFPAVPLATIHAMLEMAQSTTIRTSAGGRFDVSMLTDCTWWVSETGTTIISIQTLLLVDRDFFPVEIMWFKWTAEVGSFWFSLTFLAKYPLSILSDVAMF